MPEYSDAQVRKLVHERNRLHQDLLLARQHVIPELEAEIARLREIVGEWEQLYRNSERDNDGEGAWRIILESDAIALLAETEG